MRSVLFFVLLLITNVLFAQNKQWVNSFEKLSVRDKLRAYCWYANPIKASSIRALCLEEAIHYVIKRAEAKNLPINITSANDKLLIELNDYGKGFDAINFKIG